MNISHRSIALLATAFFVSTSLLAAEVTYVRDLTLPSIHSFGTFLAYTKAPLDTPDPDLPDTQTIVSV